MSEPLEIAHARLQEAIAMLEASMETPVDLAPIAGSIERALGSLYDAADGRGDPREALASARDETRRAAPAQLGEVRRLLEEAAASMEIAAPATLARRPLRASADVPALHHIERPSLVPRVRVVAPPPAPSAFEPLPPPATFADLETHAARAQRHIEEHLLAVLADRAEPAAEDAASPTGEAGFVAHWARECFDEIAMLSSQRTPLLGEDWRRSREIEERILSALDAFAALGAAALGAVEKLSLDAPAPDPERLFAAGLILGSVQGRDALGMAERLARSFGRDPRALARFGDALRLAPHPHLPAMLASWLDDGDPVYRETAARVLAQRGWLAGEALSRCASDRPEIAAHAVVPLALAGGAGDHLERALESDHGGLWRAGIVALALSSKSRDALERLRAALGGKHGDDAAGLLAALGNREDAARLRERALRQPSRRNIAALAVTGWIPGVDGLIGLLRHDDATIALEAARALERITAAHLYAEVALLPENLLAPDLPEPATGGFDEARLAAAVSDGRDEPAEGAPDALELPSPDYARWFAWWREHRGRFDAETRHRGGVPFTPLGAWEELAGPLLTFDERHEAATELLLLSRKHVGFAADAFVVQQLAALERWRPLLR